MVYGVAKCWTRLSDFLFHLDEWSPGGKTEGTSNTDLSFKGADLEDWGRGKDIGGERRMGDGAENETPGAMETPRAEEPGKVRMRTQG